MNDISAMESGWDNYEYRQGYLDATEGLPAIEPNDPYYMNGYNCANDENNDS